MQKSDLLQGTLDVLILKVVHLGPIHGYGISQRIQQITKENFAWRPLPDSPLSLQPAALLEPMESGIE